MCNIITLKYNIIEYREVLKKRGKGYGGWLHLQVGLHGLQKIFTIAILVGL